MGNILNLVSSRQAVIISGVLILLLFLLNLLIPALLMAASIITAFLVVTLNLRKFGIELVLFASVLIGMVHGPIAGAIVAFILIIAQLVIGQFIDMYVFWVVPGYVIAGFIAGLLGSMDVSIVGVYTTIVLNTFFLICTAIASPSYLTKFIPHTIVNTLLNWFLFTVFAPVIYGAMT